MRILTVVGARPQFIKAAPVSRSLRKAGHEEILVHTGQHYSASLSENVIEEAALPAVHENLEVGSGTHAYQIGAVAQGVSELVRRYRPRLVLVLGDTNSTLGGALGATAGGSPVVHGEAGLRSGDLRMPEEVNRIATDHMSRLLLVPTPRVGRSLEKEGVSGRIVVAGDPLLDTLAENAPDPAEMSGIEALAQRGKFLLCTVHRAQNTASAGVLGELLEILAGLDWPTLLPLHPRAAALLAGRPGFPGGGLHVLPPLSRGTTLELARRSLAVLTDSGGLQREAYFLGVPCVILRESTEWIETLESGWSILAGRDGASIRRACESPPRGKAPPDLRAFGGGKAAEAWRQAIEESFS